MRETCRIGVMAETVPHLAELVRLVRDAGFTVSVSIEAPDAPDALPQADIWVVNLDLHRAAAQAIVEALDLRGAHVIFDNDLQPPAPEKDEVKAPLPAELRLRRQRRLAQKIRQWVEPQPSAAHHTAEQKRARELWVLAASTGGPEAVIDFLRELSAPLPGVAFVYAQHIEPSGLRHLIKAVQKSTTYQVEQVDKTFKVAEKCLYVVSPEHQIELLESGTIAATQKVWSGRFKPSLNQVIAKVARVYGAKGGAIVFSGMGDDGADSCKMLRHRGGQIWVQSPETCTVDSMPVSVMGRGCHHLQADPRALAQQFIQYQKQGRQQAR